MLQERSLKSEGAGGLELRSVLVEISSKNSFYGHPFPSAVSIRTTK